MSRQRVQTVNSASGVEKPESRDYIWKCVSVCSVFYRCWKFCFSFTFLSWMCQFKFEYRNNFDRLFLFFFLFFLNPSPLQNKSYQLWCNPSLRGYNSGRLFPPRWLSCVLPGWTFEWLRNGVVWISWEHCRGFVALMRLRPALLSTRSFTPNQFQRIKSGFQSWAEWFLPSNNVAQVWLFPWFQRRESRVLRWNSKWFLFNADAQLFANSPSRNAEASARI